MKKFWFPGFIVTEYRIIFKLKAGKTSRRHFQFGDESSGKAETYFSFADLFHENVFKNISIYNNSIVNLTCTRMYSLTKEFPIRKELLKHNHKTTNKR